MSTASPKTSVRSRMNQWLPRRPGVCADVSPDRINGDQTRLIRHPAIRLRIKPLRPSPVAHFRSPRVVDTRQGWFTMLRIASVRPWGNTRIRSEEKWLARAGLNRRPPPCQGGALPLSYAPISGRTPAESATADACVGLRIILCERGLSTTTGKAQALVPMPAMPPTGEPDRGRAAWPRTWLDRPGRPPSPPTCPHRSSPRRSKP
jgi:hypothetical protein